MTSTDPAVRPTSDRAGLDRRQLLRAGAWAAPAIVLAAAVPAASASETSTTIAPELITISAICTKTGLLNKTKHGFKLTNNSSIPATLIIKFDAQAWGFAESGARNNLISATTTDSAMYGSAVSGYTYKSMWQNGAITYSTSTGGGGKNAKRTSTVPIVVPPHTTYELWQENINAAGEPKIEARINSINSIAVADKYATFSFNWLGACA